MNALAQTTWGVPILGALHVLSIALFGGALLVRELRGFKRIGLALAVSTGLLLFLSQPERVFHSQAFRVKMLLLLFAVALPAGRWKLVVWAGVIVAARAIAFW